MKNQLTFSLTIERHDDGYLAFFPALRGCNTWGASYEEAVNNAREALALYLETLADNGDSIPKETNHDAVSLGVTVRTSIIA